MTAFGVAATGDVNRFGKGRNRREVSRSREGKKVGRGRGVTRVQVERGAECRLRMVLGGRVLT